MSLLCFFGHHRSARSWANDILRTVAVAAGWRPYFSPTLTQQFKAEYNDVLLKLGYEASEGWE